jgi:hypothetical protein
VTSSLDQRRVRHILSLSGGKDSTALAVYLRDRIPELEYVFCDTGAELPETYEYLERLQAYLGRPIVYLRADEKTLFDRIRERGGFLPSPRVRWCTRELKIQPFERYVGSDYAYVYIALRSDETSRKGYIPRRPNIVPRYPFVEAGITHADVIRILETSGLGLPSSYRWRSRSGCFCCFFQQRIEWIGLLANHPELYWSAAALEKVDETTGERFTWIPGTSLAELARPETIEQVRRQHEERTTLIESKRAAFARRPTCDEDGAVGCAFCDL